jgi:Trypsin-co-occurring domain 1
VTNTADCGAKADMASSTDMGESMMERTAHPINVDGATIYIETIDVAGVGGARQDPVVSNDLKLQEIGFLDPLFDPLKDICKAVSGITRDFKAALAAAEPSEFGLELSFSLKADVRPVPVLVNGSGEGAIKVTVLWKKA